MYMYSPNGILLSHKKNEILPYAATWMDFMLTEISPTEKDKYLWYHFYVESKKIQQISDYNRKEADSQIERTN